MKKVIALIIAFIFTSYSNLANAGAGWSGEATVTSIYALSEKSALIKLSSFINPGNCSVSSSGDIWIDPSVSKTWFTLLLSAHMAGKKVNIYVVDSCQTTHWPGQSFAVIGHVRVF